MQSAKEQRSYSDSDTGKRSPDAVKVTDTVKVTVTKDGGQTPQEDGKTPPKTGDETAPFFPFVLALAAGAVVMITRKKNG